MANVNIFLENFMKKSTFVNSELKTRATASLKAEIEEELNIPDPDSEKAKAFLQRSEEEATQE